MPIDPRIPLLAFQGGGGGTLSNPMGLMQDFVRLQQEQEQLRKQQREAQQEQEIQTIMQQSGGDWDRAVDGLLARGYGGVAAKLRTEVEQGRKVAADKLDQQFRTDLAKFDLALKAFDGIEDLEESQREITYQIARGFALQQAEGIPGVAELFPDNYDQQAVDRIRQIGSKGNEFLTGRLAALKAMGSGDLHTSLALGLSASESPETWAETIQGFRQLAGSKMADPIIAQFGAEFSPESLEKARTFLTTPRTPEQANVQRGQDISAATAIRGQDVSAATQQRGQDIGAATTRRGQDISAATQRRGQDLQGTAGISPASAMPSEFQTALARSMLAVPATRRGMIVSTAERLWREGKQDELKELIRQSAIEGENVESKERVRGRMATIATLNDGRQLLQEMKAAGVNTNILRGTWEDAMRALGKTSNPAFASFAVRMQAALINYRRTATGVQFSERESAEYEKMFPNYRNELPVNEAVIDGLLREMGTQDKTYWEGKLGRSGAELVGALPKPQAGGGGERVRVRGPNGETGTVPANSPLPPGWTVVK